MDNGIPIPKPSKVTSEITRMTEFYYQKLIYYKHIFQFIIIYLINKNVEKDKSIYCQ